MTVIFSRSTVRKLSPLLGLCALGFAGCRSGGGGGQDDAVVRLINAAPETDDLSVAVDGQRVWKHALFRSNTGFAGVGEGTYKVDLTAQQNGVRLTGNNYILCQKGKAYTVVALSPPGNSTDAPALRIFNEDKDSPVPGDKVRLRFINAGDRLGRVDILFNNIVGLGDIPFGTRSGALLLDPGAYDVRVNAVDEMSSLVGPVSLHFLPGHAYTLVAMGRRGVTNGQESLSLETYPDNP